MQEFIYFLGRFHVLALHVPVGLVLLGIFTELLSRHKRHAWLRPAVPQLWACTALSALLTVILGLMHYSEGGFVGASATAHRAWGIAFTATLVGVWLFSSFRFALYRRTALLLNGILLVQVIMTGHYGGNLTHGETFLVEYAPAPLRSLAGLPPRRAPAESLAEADPFHDVINPLLQSRCVSCHNADKQRGQLNLASLDTLMAGGEDGPVVVSGDSQASLLFQRISLPSTHEDFMPAEGKTPLTDEEVVLVGWWIDADMPVDTTVAALTVGEDISRSLSRALGFDTDIDTAPALPLLDEELLASLRTERFLVRPLSESGTGYSVINEVPGLAINEQRLAVLADSSESIVELELSGSSLYDEHLDSLSGFSHLSILNVSRNRISNAGLPALSRLPALRILNLYGNEVISDEGVTQLAEYPALETVYLWGTGVTPEGINALRGMKPGLRIIVGGSAD